MGGELSQQETQILSALQGITSMHPIEVEQKELKKMLIWVKSNYPNVDPGEGQPSERFGAFLSTADSGQAETDLGGKQGGNTGSRPDSPSSFCSSGSLESLKGSSEAEIPQIPKETPSAVASPGGGEGGPDPSSAGGTAAAAARTGEVSGTGVERGESGDQSTLAAAQGGDSKQPAQRARAGRAEGRGGPGGRQRTRALTRLERPVTQSMAKVPGATEVATQEAWGGDSQNAAAQGAVRAAEGEAGSSLMHAPATGMRGMVERNPEDATGKRDLSHLGRVARTRAGRGAGPSPRGSGGTWRACSDDVISAAPGAGGAAGPGGPTQNGTGAARSPAGKEGGIPKGGGRAEPCRRGAVGTRVFSLVPMATQTEC